MKFHITGSRAARPDAARVIFCDGAVDGTYRVDADLELSHWIPNRTPAAFKADTSTEICMNFVAAGAQAEFDLAVNNHVDVDGVVSVFVLLHPQLALEHRRTLVGAAEIGDFWGWGGPPALELFQAVVCLIDRLRTAQVDAQEIYAQCFERIRAMLGGEHFAECEVGLQALSDAIALIDRGEVTRDVIGPRLVHYAIGRALAERHLAAALRVPSFNIPLSRQCLLPPQARARLDRERVQLVSIETADGWYWDLWYPGHTWADTIRLWRPPGITSAGSSNQHRLDHPPLQQAADELTRLDAAAGRWAVSRTLSPFATLQGRGFSVVASHLRDDRPAPSSLSPATVLRHLAPAFDA